jgi:hypothetical protein
MNRNALNALQRLVVPCLIATSLGACVAGANREAVGGATPAAIVATAPAAVVIDHTVLLGDPSVLHAPNPAPMAVAAYDE